MNDEAVQRPAPGGGAPAGSSEAAAIGSAAGGASSAATAYDALAWGIAATPLLLPLAGYVSAYAGQVPPRHWIYLLPAAVSFPLMLADKGRTRAAGGAARPLPSSAWALLPVVYLWRRASALRLAQHQAWTWICLSVANSFLFFAAVTAGAYQVYAVAPEVPGCADPSIAATLEDLFDTLPLVKQGKTTAVSVSRQAEVVAGRSAVGWRSCTAMILDHDDEEVAAAYQIELRGAEVIVHLQLLDVTGWLPDRGRAG